MRISSAIAAAIAIALGLGAAVSSAAPSPRADATASATPRRNLPSETEDVWTRIRRGFRMKPYESPAVNAEIRRMLRHPKNFERAAERAALYLYYIVGEVEARGMPTELALLPFVESSFVPHALSRAKAAGLWQFIPQTGSKFSLDQNIWKDERRDVIESTRAALDYFGLLHEMFNDWHLALAAYNWGEGNVTRALASAKRRGKPLTYAGIRKPSETGEYVPRLEAVKRLILKPWEYGIEIPDIASEPYFVQLFCDKDHDASLTARLSGLEPEEFRDLNPGQNKPVIVGSHDNAILIPADNIDQYLENLAIWRSFGYRTSDWTTRRYGRGQSLEKIAKDAGMTVEELRRVNGIPSNRRVAENSLLLVRAASDEPRAEINGDEAYFKLEPAPRAASPGRYRVVRYRVRKGDTLASIARRMNVTTRSIIVSNRLRSSDIKAGTYLSITVPVVKRTQAKPASGSPSKREKASR